MVSIDGIITTVAGNGSSNYTGDGGLAVDAQLNFPRGVFADENDRVFKADTESDVIRMVDKNGIISTVAGAGPPGYSGDGGPAVDTKMNTPYGVFVLIQTIMSSECFRFKVNLFYTGSLFLLLDFLISFSKYFFC
jgi:hypothetical protein